MNRHFFRRFYVMVALLGGSLALSSCNDVLDSGAWVKPSITLTKSDLTSINYRDIVSHTYRSGTSYTYNAMPPTGDVNVLVIPVEFTGYPFVLKNDKDEIVYDRLADMNAMFNGTDSDVNYWKSLSGFYKESSFEKLNIHATIAETCQMNITPSVFMADPDSNGKSTDYTSAVVSLLSKAVNDYKTLHGNDSTKAFDQDGDGIIDGVYLVYSSYDYQTAKAHSLSVNDTYWAFTARATPAPSVNSPNASNFTWASFDFMYSGVSEGVGVDSHTFVHETGHMLGLEDYYNYDDINDNANISLRYRHYTPTGALDMMDYNILDHNMWSKFALGWGRPYVIDSSMTFPLTVTLKDSVSSDGDFILIPDASSVYNGTAFGEYLMVELYAPTGLNQLDSETSYRGTRPHGFRSGGVKITHIDSRLALYINNQGDYVDEVTEADLASTNGTRFYSVVASNTPSSSGEKAGYRLVHLLESNASLTFDNYDEESGEPFPSYSYANDATLFTGNHLHNRFSMETFSAFFENGTKFNNGHSFGYSIKVNQVQAASDGSYAASITISKD